MVDNYLMLNGKRIDLTEEQVKTLTAEEKKNPFARVEKDSEYVYIHSAGQIDTMREDYLPTDEKLFSVANYCTDKVMMEQRAWHETLNRLLWRYSEEHGGDSEWDGDESHFSIAKSYNSNKFYAEEWLQDKTATVVYFKDKEAAQAAIEEIVKPFMEEHPEFVW